MRSPIDKQTKTVVSLISGMPSTASEISQIMGKSKRQIFRYIQSAKSDFPLHFSDGKYQVTEEELAMGNSDANVIANVTPNVIANVTPKNFVTDSNQKGNEAQEENNVIANVTPNVIANVTPNPPSQTELNALLETTKILIEINSDDEILIHPEDRKILLKSIENFNNLLKLLALKIIKYEDQIGSDQKDQISKNQNSKDRKSIISNLLISEGDKIGRDYLNNNIINNINKINKLLFNLLNNNNNLNINKTSYRLYEVKSISAPGEAAEAHPHVRQDNFEKSKIDHQIKNNQNSVSENQNAISEKSFKNKKIISSENQNNSQESFSCFRNSKSDLGIQEYFSKFSKATCDFSTPEKSKRKGVPIKNSESSVRKIPGSVSSDQKSESVGWGVGSGGGDFEGNARVDIESAPVEAGRGVVGEMDGAAIASLLEKQLQSFGFSERSDLEDQFIRGDSSLGGISSDRRILPGKSLPKNPERISEIRRKLSSKDPKGIFWRSEDFSEQKLKELERKSVQQDRKGSLAARRHLEQLSKPKIKKSRNSDVDV